MTHADALTPEEVAAATGKRQPAAQAALLAKRGVPFVFFGRGVRVERAVAIAHQLLADKPTPGRGVDLSRVR